MLVAHRQVFAFDQTQAQVTRQIGVLKVTLVVGPGREQSDARLSALWCAAFDAVHQSAVARGQALHLQAGKGLRELARDGDAVFQQIAQARRRLRALAHHPPTAIGAVRQVKRGDVQPRAIDGLHTVHGTQKTGVSLHQGGGQQGAAQQVAGAIQVGHDGVEQARALQHAGLDVCPIAGAHDHREQVQRPRALRPTCVGVDVVGDAVVAHLALQLFVSARDFGRGVGTVDVAEFKEALPMRAQWRITGVGLGAQLVPVSGVGRRGNRVRPV